MREQILEMLIGKGIITEEEFDKRVEEARKGNTLLQDREVLANLSMITLENDGQVAEMLGAVFQSIDMLSEMVVMQSMQMDMMQAEIDTLKGGE